MRRCLAVLVVSVLAAGSAEAAPQRDAKLCFEGTKRPAEEYLAPCARALKSGRLNRINRAMTFNNRGVIFLHLGDPDAALDDFDKAIRINPDNWRARFNRTMIRIERGAYQEAWEDANHAIKLRPGDSRAYVNRAIVYTRTRQLDAALRDLDYALILNPRDLLGLHWRAMVFAGMDEPDRALADTDAAIAAGIDSFIRRGLVNGNIYLYRSLTLYKSGDAKAALADVERLIALNPKNSRAYNQRAWIMATHPDPALRDGKQAVRSARAAVELDDRPANRDTLAAALAEAGRFDDAVAEQEAAIAMLEDAGKTQEAASFRKALEAYRRKEPRREDPAAK